jgi:hypothetical protein
VYSTVTKYIYIQSTTVYVPAGIGTPPTPLSQANVPLPPEPKGGGHTRWCNVSPSPTDVSPTENSWLLHPLDKVSLGYFAPDRTIPSLNSDWIERSDIRLPTAARFSARKRWSSLCGPSVHQTEGRQINKPGQGRRRSRPDAPLIF